MEMNLELRQIVFLILATVLSGCSTGTFEDVRHRHSSEESRDESSLELRYSDSCAAMGGTRKIRYFTPPKSWSDAPVDGALKVERCVVNVANTVCGLPPDRPGLSQGAPLNVEEPAGAENLFIFVMGGGACWNAETCGISGLIPTISNSKNKPEFWQELAINDPFISKSRGVIDGTYRKYEIPYCTGDTHAGDNVAVYGGKPFRHKGYRNFAAYLDFILARNPSPKKIVVLGSSGGAVGTHYNLRQIRDRWPTQPLYVVADSGVPANAELFPSGLSEVRGWGVEKTLPQGTRADGLGLVQFNVAKYASDENLRFGLIQPYSDAVMFGFSLSLNIKQPALANFHKGIDLVAAEFQRTDNFKVNLFDDQGAGKIHICYSLCENVFPERYAQVEQWVSDMVSDSPNWQNYLKLK